jgi:hypothetical protein
MAEAAELIGYPVEHLDEAKEQFTHGEPLSVSSRRGIAVETLR